MKPKAIPLLLAATALAATTACTNDDNAVAVDNNAPVAARITAGMADDAVATPATRAGNPATRAGNPATRAGQPGTRAVDDRWNRDTIGVIVTESPNSDMQTRYRNARYVTTSTTTTAEFTPADKDNTIYFTDPDETVTFIAYAPYRPSATPGTLPGTNGDGKMLFDMRSQTTPAEQEAVDVIFCGGATASKSNPIVSFKFGHLMSRLVLKIQTPAENGFSPDDVNRISAVKLGGLCTTGYLKVGIDNGFSFDSEETSRTEEWDITQNMNRVETKNGVTQRIYTLIIPSMQHVKDKDGKTLGAIPLSITLDEQEYKNAKDLKGNPNTPGHFSYGKSYEYTIRLKKTGLDVTHATIQNWTDGGSGSGDATKQ